MPASRQNVVPLKPRRAAKARPPEGLDLESMWNSPSMRGMLSFLDVSPEERLQRLQAREAEEVPQTGYPVLPEPETKAAETTEQAKQGTPVIDTLSEAPLKQESLEEGTVKQGTLDSEEPDLRSLSELGRTFTAAEPQRMVLAQDAHTPGEELLYSKMWARATPVPGKPFRILTIGIKKLTAMVGLSKTDNCKNNLQGLAGKLAIDDLGVAPNPNYGHVYRVWDQSAILQRRRERGLTHYIRNRRAVNLVNPGGVLIQGTPFSTTGDPVQGTPFSIAGDLEQGTPSAKTGYPLPGKEGYPQTGPHIRNRNSEEDVRPPSSPHAAASQAIVEALLGVMGECDDEAAARIVAAAHQGRPGIPEAVIIQIVEMKGPRIRKSPNVAYPLRVLEKAVLETASGLTGANLCKAWDHAQQQRVAQDAQRRSEELATARSILADPTGWPDDDGYWVRWAKAVLDGHNPSE